MSDWGGRGKYRTYQEAIGQPIVQEEHKVWNDADRLGVDEILVSERARRQGVVARELSVINVGNGLNVEVHRSEYRHKRERGHSVGHEPPPDPTPCAIAGTEQRLYTLKEYSYDDPWSDRSNR